MRDTTLTQPDFCVVRSGLCDAIACSIYDDEETTRRLNLEHPTGISSQWRITEPEDGSGSHIACADSPDTHQHIFFTC